MTSVETDPYQDALVRVYERLAPHFRRAEPRRRAWTYIRDLPQVSETGRRKGIAAGRQKHERRGDGVQRLLNSANWDQDAAQRELQAIVRELAPSADCGLFVTEIAFRKKGATAAGVARQFSRQEQRLENCQIGIMLLAVVPGEAAFVIDRRLYVPPAREGDTGGSAASPDIPDASRQLTKSQLALEMISGAFDSGFNAAWVAAYLTGNDQRELHSFLRRRNIPHLLSATAREYASCIAETVVPAGPGGPPAERCLTTAGTFTLIASLDRASHRTMFVEHQQPSVRGARSTSFLVHAPRSMPLSRIADLMATTCTTASNLAPMMEEVGFDHYEVRSWRGWHRHMTLACAVQIVRQLADLSVGQGQSAGRRTSTARVPTPLPASRVRTADLRVVAGQAVVDLDPAGHSADRIPVAGVHPPRRVYDPLSRATPPRRLPSR
jgi:SRSO17 transposase